MRLADGQVSVHHLIPTIPAEADTPSAYLLLRVGGAGDGPVGEGRVAGSAPLPARAGMLVVPLSSAVRCGWGDHRIPAMRDHPSGIESCCVESAQRLYTIRLDGHLGATLLSAFPTMAAETKGPDTVLTGLVEDRSALFAMLAEIEALGLELAELRRICPATEAGASGDGPSANGA
jgi:hypothetical protein